MNDVYTIHRGGSRGFLRGELCAHRAHFESLEAGIQGPLMGAGRLEVLVLDALICRNSLIPNGIQKQNKT